jgi:sRNA-binding regulator protein Hfq
MKDTVDPQIMDRAAELEGFANRKLIRPVLHRVEHGHNPAPHSSNPGNQSDQAPPPGRPSSPGPSRVYSHAPNPGHNPVSNHSHGAPNGDRRGGPGGGKKTPPAETTHAENFYYQKQMQSHTQMVIVLRDGEEVHGIIEWYDHACLKLNRLDGPNLMIYKPSIKYMYKEGEESK